jgi:hypothetical protein
MSFLNNFIFLSSQWCEISYGNESLPTGRESLIDKYLKIEKELEESSFAIPFYLESSVSKNVSHVDIYGIMKYEYPFDIIQNELLLPTNWCEIVLLHSNEETNVTNDDPILTGKIALAHLNEFPDYYDRLETLEKEADKFWRK